jgi:hypothetical protein
MLTSGDEMLFVRANAPDPYGLSRIFSPFVANTELVTVVQILRQFSQETCYASDEKTFIMDIASKIKNLRQILFRYN